MARTIKTTRQDIYIRLVRNAKRDRGSEEDEEEDVQASEDDSQEYLFQYQYELFSFAAAIGYLRDEQIAEPETYSRDILPMTRLEPENEHRPTIDFINKLVQIDRGADDMEAVWDDVLRYADAGVEHLGEELDVQEDFDMVRFVRDSDADRWMERFEETVGSPEEVGTLYE
jgi:hypothetical protein